MSWSGGSAAGSASASRTRLEAARQRLQQAQHPVQRVRRQRLLGGLRQRPHPRSTSTTSTSCLWRKQDTLVKKILGGWQVSGVTYFQSGIPLTVWRGDDYAGVGDTTAQPWDLVGDSNVGEPAVLPGGRGTRTSGSTPRRSRPGDGTFGNAGRNIIGDRSRAGTSRSSRTSRSGHAAPASAGSLQLHQPPQLGQPERRPRRTALFGRITAQDRPAHDADRPAVRLLT